MAWFMLHLHLFEMDQKCVYEQFEDHVIINFKEKFG